MKTFSSDLLTLLGTDVPIDRADLYTIGPCLNGAMTYATNAQVGFTFNGHFYDPAAYGNWQREEIEVKIGLESNGCKMTLTADTLDPQYFPGTNGNAMLLDGLKYGLLANATVVIQTLYNSDYLTGYSFPATTGPTGGGLIETKFVGLVTTIEDLGETTVKVNLQDELYLLNRQVPSRLTQSGCSHTLYDVGCSLAAASYVKTGAVAAVLDTTANGYVFNTSVHIAPTSTSGTFAQGRLKWLTGNNAGLSCFVRSYTAGTSSDTFQLDIQPIFAIASGDTFDVWEGCNHTLARCIQFQGSTNAMINFGGQPNVPVPETAVG